MKKRRKAKETQSESKFEQFYKELEDLCKKYGFYGTINTTIWNKINIYANLYAPLSFLKKREEV